MSEDHVVIAIDQFLGDQRRGLAIVLDAKYLFLHLGHLYLGRRLQLPWPRH